MPPRASCPLQRDDLVPEFCEVIPSTLEATETVLTKVLEVVKALPCAPGEVDDIELALREGLANAILHGNRNDPTKKVIVASFCECDQEGGLLLVVCDEGSGFDPAVVPDPTTAETIYSGHGRGIFLMRQIMDDVRYRNGGCEVELRKRRRPA